jgi:hypothetical protein
VLKVRPRTKKVVKKQLNNLIARRPSRDELISKNIIATKTSETTVDSVPDVETIQRCVEFLISTEGKGGITNIRPKQQKLIRT